MYSLAQDHHTHTAAAARTKYDLQPPPCASAERSLQQLSAHHQRSQQVIPAATAIGGVQQQQQVRRAGKKKHGARPASRRSSTTVVATDVANFRAMVQELTGFPPAAIFRPMPRRVHAAVNSPALFAAAAARQQGCGDGRGGQAGSENTAGSSSLTADAAVVQPAAMAQSPQCPLPPGVFDGLADIGSPVFDPWVDLSIE